MRSKINDADFISFVNKFDFVCLLETFVDDLKTNVFYSCIHFVSPAVKLSRAGRRSGGVLLLIKKSLADYVQEIDLGVENIITMKLSRQLSGISADVFLLCVYSAPLKSPLYSKSNFNNGISAVQHCLLTITEKIWQCYYSAVILMYEQVASNHRLTTCLCWIWNTLLQ